MSLQLRSFAAVLFRRIASKQPENSEALSSRMIDQLSPESRETVKALLLRALSNEQVNDVRHKICDTISELTVGTNGKIFFFCIC